MLNKSDIIRGCTDTVILKMLENKDSYGYEINKTVVALSGGELEFKEATLYTIFRRLEKDECVISYWGDENTGARRRYYSITEKGRKLLNENIEDWRQTNSMINNVLKIDLKGEEKK